MQVGGLAAKGAKSALSKGKRSIDYKENNQKFETSSGGESSRSGGESSDPSS